jgi:hypothetical protein
VKPLQWFDTWQKRVVGVASTVGTIVGAILGVMALVSHFQSKGPAPCPGVSKGEISKVTTNQLMRYRDYLELSGASTDGTSAERLRTLGRIVHFRVDVNGYRGADLPVVWWMFTKAGGPVSEPQLRNQLAFTLTPHDCTTGGTREIWVQLPKRSGTFRVQVRLLDAGGEQLDDGFTKPFVVHA